MNDSKRRIVLLSILVGVLLIVGFWVLIMQPSKGSKREDEAPSQLQKEFESLVNSKGSVSDYKTFFTVTKILDNLDNKLSRGEADYLVDIYDPKYLSNNSLNKKNIVETINPYLFTYKHFIQNINYDCSKYNCFYFFETVGEKQIYGDIQPINIGVEKFFLNVDLVNSTYYISPILENISLDEYINSFNYSKQTINKNNNNEFNYKYPVTLDIINYYLGYTEFVLVHDENAF